MNRQTRPLNFFLNEQHELVRGEKSAFMRQARYEAVDWASKGRALSKSLATTAANLEKSSDPLKAKRYFLLAKPTKDVRKLSKDKRKAPNGVAVEATDYAGDHGRLLTRLGLDLVQVQEDGSATVHARPEQINQLISTAALLEASSDRERNRWIAVESFDEIPAEYRYDEIWLKTLDKGSLADTIIELQPLLDRLDIDVVIHTISQVLNKQGGEGLTGNGTDYSGRNWFRGRLSIKSIQLIAQKLFSVQALHGPLYAKAASAAPSTTKFALPPAGLSSLPSNLPTIAVVDAGVPTNHSILSQFRQGQFYPGSSYISQGEHGSRVTSRIVFGETQFDPATMTVAPEENKICKYIDVNIAVDSTRLDEKQIVPAMMGVKSAFPHVRVFNLSFSHTESVQGCSPTVRQQRMLLLQDLENFAFSSDSIVVVAAGNSPVGLVPRTPYPNHYNEESWKLGCWSVGFNTLTCGSFVLRLSPNAVVKNSGWPSPFTRVGPGICNAPTPMFSAHGGNEGPKYSYTAGDGGVWVCDQMGRWHEDCGTSFATPLIARQAAFALEALQQVCQQGTEPFAATVKAIMRLTAQCLGDGASIRECFELTLGKGYPDITPLVKPRPNSAILVWQGLLQNSKDVARIQLPIPKTWLDRATDSVLRVVVAWNTPVNASAASIWACRRMSYQLRTGLDEEALRTSAAEHANFPLSERVYHLKKLPKGTTINGDIWLLEIHYEEIAQYYPGVDVNPQQKVGVAMELVDQGAGRVSPQEYLQALPIAATMTSIGVTASAIPTSVTLKI